jgi:membrane peptidoglycan carboxypeptidase
MARDGFITKEELVAAQAEKITFKPKQTEGIKAPHFVFYVIDQLNQKYGEDMVRNGGLRVTTTLDYDLQKKGEEIAKKNALENKEKFNAENAAFVAIDPKTGAILSMVGSRDYFDKDIDGNFNAAISPNRQPGSTFKPFVYSEAFIKGYTPETVLFDARTQFSTNCAPDNLTSENGCYSPENYDQKNRGPLTLRESLAQSINVTSVKTLYLAGLSDSLNLAKKMGVESLKGPDQYGLTLVLGGGEVSLLEMTGAYSVFANEGVRNNPFSILEVKDASGTTLEQWSASPREVLPRDIALKISDVLSDNVARAPAYGQTSFLYFPNQDVAVKTGTTNDYHDVWVVGYTPSVVIGMWAGNNDNTPIDKRTAGFVLAPIWKKAMTIATEGTQVEYFPDPLPNTSDKPILKGQYCLSDGVHTILTYVVKNDPNGNPPYNPYQDSQYELWETGIHDWISKHNLPCVSAPSTPTTSESTLSIQASTTVTN